MTDTKTHHEGEMLYQAYLAWKELGGFEEYDIEEFIREVKSTDATGYNLRVQDFVDGFRQATILYNVEREQRESDCSS